MVACDGVKIAANASKEAYLDGLQAGTAAGRPPTAVAAAAWQIRLKQAVAGQRAAIDDWQARRARRADATGKTRDVQRQAGDTLPKGPAQRRHPRRDQRMCGCAPPKAAPLTSAAPPTSKACTPASRTAPAFAGEDGVGGRPAGPPTQSPASSSSVTGVSRQGQSRLSLPGSKPCRRSRRAECQITKQPAPLTLSLPVNCPSVERTACHVDDLA